MKRLILLSGGMDSATILGVLKQMYPDDECIALNLHYGQRHRREIECARALVEHYGIQLIEKDISQAMDGIKSALIVNAQCEIKDEAEKATVGGTYVPGRNVIFLSLAASIAESIGATKVYYGAHAEDHGGYPDCTPEFFAAMQEAVAIGTATKIDLVAPYILLQKRDIVRDGIEAKVPYELTHSCYRGEYPACGTCPTCQLRIKAFKEAGYEDPIEYKV